MNSTNLLREEHKLILRALDVLDAMIETQGRFDEDDVARVLDFVRVRDVTTEAQSRHRELCVSVVTSLYGTKIGTSNASLHLRSFMLFKDRLDAGRKLAEALEQYKNENAVIYALPRGGVVLGAEIARRLVVPLDLIIVRKVGHPYSPEYGIAAVAEDGHTVVNRFEVESVDKRWFEEAVRVQQHEARRRRELYMQGLRPIPATDKTAILVDDGLATGLTMLGAIQEVQHARPRKIVVAVPVAPPQTVDELEQVADEVIALHVKSDFGAIGSFYSRFDQVSDEEVIELMKSAHVSLT